MNYRQRLLAASIIAAMSMTGTALAQSTGTDQATEAGKTAQQAEEKKAQEFGTVTVTGIRASLQQALDTKRNADAIVDVITAEDVGKFPATNVAEAMTIIPGVTVDRLFGQGERVSILGTDPALNRTLLNGQTVASADWFIVDQPGRTFNYSLLAPQIVGKVEVFKSPEARLDEGSIGGTVIVSTRKPLDMKANSISGSLGYLYNDRSRKNDPQASVMYSWKNKDETFGVAVAYQHSVENIRRDGVESYGTVSAENYRDGLGGGGSINNLPTDWSVAPNPDGSQPLKAATCVGSCATTLQNNLTARGPNSLSASFFEQERKRDTLSAAVQFRPIDKLDIEFNALKVKASYDNLNQSMFAFMGNAYNGLMKMTDVTIQDNVITKGTFVNALSVFDVQNRKAKVDTDSYDLKATWNDDGWFASIDIGTTKATGGTSRQVFGEFLNWADYSYDISGAPGKPGSVTFSGSNPFSDPSAFRMDGGWGADPSAQATWNTGWGGNVVFKPTTDKEHYGQVDFGINFDSPVNLLRFGYKQRKHQTSQTMGGVALASVVGYGDAPASMFKPHDVPGNYLNGFSGVGNDMKDRFYIDGDALAEYILSNKWLAPWQTAPVPGTFNDPSFVANTWLIDEDVKAAYVQADFATGPLRGNVGVRYVRTSSDSNSFACTVNVSPCPADKYAPINVRKKYNNLLPNVNVAYEAANDVVLRFSAAKVMSRPNYGDMSSYLWIGDQTLSGGGGNPNLNPYRSTNYDFSAEWYFSPDAILAASVFYKDVQDYILVTTRPETHYNQSQSKDDVYQVSRPDNAGTATIKGVALAYQQNFGGGFGLIANYTYSDGEASTGDPMPYNSKQQVNISPFFENDKLSARLTWSRRSTYFTNVDRGDNLFVRPYTSLDATIGYSINKNFGISLDAMNLLDEPYQSYATKEVLTRGVYRSGRRYMASLKFQF